MKRAALIILLLLCCCTLFSQNRKWIDSLQQLLQLEKREDTIQVRRYIRLSASYTTNRPDSALYYCQLALELSEKLNYSWGIGYSYRNYSSVFKVMGDYPLAWGYLQKAKRVFEEREDEQNVIGIDFASGTLNYEQGNYPEALKIFLHLKSANEEWIAKSDYNIFYVFLGSTYNYLQMPDSGLYYMKKYFGENPFVTTPGKSFPFRVMGDTYFGLKKYDSALNFYRLSYSIGINMDVGAVINTAIGLATLHKEIGNSDSCIYYANIALSEAQSGNFLQWVRQSSKILAVVYETVNPLESIRYYKLSASISDSINSQQKLMQVQSIKYTEELRKRENAEKEKANKAKQQRYLLIGGIAAFALITLILVRNNRHKQKAKVKIEKAYDELKATQAQLIQSEKMASLGELTAGIAHEIQNPLNFVNNFSEVNKELIDEMRQELKSGKIDDAIAISNDIRDNEEKIIHHGKRADAIVKGMLQHSRSSSGKKEPTNINALADEYLRLAYHGLRAKDKMFNATMITDYDETIGNINIIPQDIGRVILNLINNAFYATNEKQKSPHPLKGGEEYEPTVTVSTKRLFLPSGSQTERREGTKFEQGGLGGGSIEIKISDNGGGIPKKILDKIFQPFFTTKPTGQGTGLGLSLSFDIVKAHGGELKVESGESEGSSFIISLPVS